MVREQWLSVAGQDTFCRITGDISKRAPIVVVHGGPGFSWDYLEPLDILFAQHGIPLIHYDQYGCGRSSKNNETILPSLAVYASQLQDVVSGLGVGQDYNVLGHSAGAMIALEHALTRPEGLRGLILANAFASIDLFMRDARRLKADRALVIGNSLGVAPATVEAADVTAAFFEHHVCRTKPVPEPLLRTLAASADSTSVFETLWGASPFELTGSYSGWSAIDRLAQIEVPTLAYRGEYDEVGSASFTPFAAIPNAKLETIGNTSHVPHLEAQQETCRLIAAFVASRCR